MYNTYIHTCDYKLNPNLFPPPPFPEPEDRYRALQPKKKMWLAALGDIFFFLCAKAEADAKL